MIFYALQHKPTGKYLEKKVKKTGKLILRVSPYDANFFVSSMAVYDWANLELGIPMTELYELFELSAFKIIDESKKQIEFV